MGLATSASQTTVDHSIDPPQLCCKARKLRHLFSRPFLNQTLGQKMKSRIWYWMKAQRILLCSYAESNSKFQQWPIIHVTPQKQRRLFWFNRIIQTLNSVPGDFPWSKHRQYGHMGRALIMFYIWPGSSSKKISKICLVRKGRWHPHLY